MSNEETMVVPKAEVLATMRFSTDVFNVMGQWHSRELDDKAALEKLDILCGMQAALWRELNPEQFE